MTAASGKIPYKAKGHHRGRHAVCPLHQGDRIVFDPFNPIKEYTPSDWYMLGPERQQLVKKARKRKEHWKLMKRN
jgi:hypothetical protein